MPPPGAQGPPPGGEHPGITLKQDKVVVGVTTMLLFLSLVAVSIRLLARRKQKVSLGADDYAALCSLVRNVFP